MLHAFAAPSTGQLEMRRQSYLGRIAGVPPARGPRLTVPPDVAGDPPMTLALSSLLHHLSNPPASAQPPAKRHETPALEAATAEAALGEPAFAGPEPGPPLESPVIPFQRPAQAAIPAAVKPPTRRPAMPRAPREERPVTTSGPARSAVGAPATIGTPLEPHRTVPRKYDLASSGGGSAGSGARPHRHGRGPHQGVGSPGSPARHHDGPEPRGDGTDARARIWVALRVGSAVTS
jgi:hypothetical protein